MKSYFKLILFFTLLGATLNAVSKNRKSKRKHGKQLFNLTFVYDNIVKDSNLCPLLKQSFISKYNITNLTIVRLNSLNSNTSINPINSINGVELGAEFSEAVQDTGFYNCINNYFSSIKNTKHKTFIYADKIKQVYAFDNNITCIDTSSLNYAIVNELSNEEYKKNPCDVIVYIPSVKNQRNSPPKKEAKIERNITKCNQIINLKFLFDINEELYGTKEFNDGNRFQTILNTHSDNSYYFICDSICGADRFQFEYTEIKSGLKKTEVYFLNDITNQTININNKLTSFKGKYAFKMPPKNIVTDSEYEICIYGEDTTNRIYRTSEKINKQRVVFAKCPF